MIDYNLIWIFHLNLCKKKASEWWTKAISSPEAKSSIGLTISLMYVIFQIWSWTSLKFKCLDLAQFTVRSLMSFILERFQWTKLTGKLRINMNSLPIWKFYKLLLTRQESKDMSKCRNWQRPNIKTIFNSFNGSKDIMISTVETEVKITMEIKEEEMLRLISVLPKRMSFLKVSTQVDRLLAIARQICQEKRLR